MPVPVMTVPVAAVLWQRCVVTPEVVPTIDVGALLAVGASSADRRRVAAQVGAACERYGFFQVVGHGLDPALRRDLHSAAEQFFALDEAEKDAVAMRHGGPAWRGWFGVGNELTSGVPDDKEGLYFGTELSPEDPRVVAGLALHGPNQFPERPVELAALVTEWMERTTALGIEVMSAIASALGLDERWFDPWLADPTVLFRIFHYPPPAAEFVGSWGVAEHTDYGFLTLLVQDDSGGLEVRVGEQWIDVPPTDDAIVCNLGDMLERVTGGRYRSTPHRVRLPRRDRYSFPLFLDPAWDAGMAPIPGMEPNDRALADAARGRWDGRGVLDVTGPYGDYLLAKVSRAFPELFTAVVDDT